MIYAFDVRYEENSAFTACVGFESWSDKELSSKSLSVTFGFEPYRAGEFYKRELPPLLNAIKELKDIDYIVIDGYVWLGDERRAGLGEHLYMALNRQIPIIGVAKSKYKDTPKESELFRGNSKKPLYVTTAGVELEMAKSYILNMYGDFRIPKLLREVDRISKNKKI